MRFDADFQDMVAVRDFLDGKVGKKLSLQLSERGLLLRYSGEDRKERCTSIAWSVPEADMGEDGNVTFHLKLDAGESRVDFTIAPVIDGNVPAVYSREEAIERLHASYREWMNGSTGVRSDLPLFNELFRQGLLDLRVQMTDLGSGSFPVAGLPWYEMLCKIGAARSWKTASYPVRLLENIPIFVRSASN